MAKEYTYAAVGDKYFCLQTSILVLTWILLVQYKALHLGSLGIQRRQILYILKSLVKFRLFGPAEPSDSITLPVYGHLILNVHRGYKIFNFSSLNATKLFDREVSTAVARKEIETVTEAGLLDFAPTILEVDTDSRWYTETFIPAKRSQKNEQLNPVIPYNDIVVEHLRKMVLLRPIRKENLSTYSHDLRCMLADQLTHSYLSGELAGKVETFVETINAQLAEADNILISLAWTHGDFSFVNFIYPDNRILVIDWEDARERSLLHDLFNYFFTEIYYERTQSNLATEINGAILLLVERINLEEVTKSFNTADIMTVYRCLFYLERMSMLLGREASTSRSRVIQRTIDIFSAYES